MSPMRRKGASLLLVAVAGSLLTAPAGAQSTPRERVSTDGTVTLDGVSIPLT